jgi:hypothetical protein
MSEFRLEATARVLEKRYENGDLVRYEIVSPESWLRLRQVSGHTDADMVKEITRLFQANILPGKTKVGPVVLFAIPTGMEDPFPPETEIGTIVDQDRRIKYWLGALFAQGRLRIEKGKLIFENATYSSFWETLSLEGLTGIAEVYPGDPVFLPMYKTFGTLLNHSRNSVVFNSHFFQIETTDCATIWDVTGEPFGLLILNGKILLPPLFGREALFVGKSGRNWIGRPSLEELEVRIGSKIYFHGHGCEFYSRPATERTPQNAGMDLVVVGRRLVGWHDGGCTEIPESGFVIQTSEKLHPDSLEVEYSGFGNAEFAVQVGPALVKDGRAVSGFGFSAFWNGDGPVFPPSVYPLDWEKGRAARLGLGSRDRKPLIVWVEGAKKHSYRRGVDSCGASLAEFAQICVELGVENFVSLDGGGSAQICIDSGRLLRLSDRYPHSGKDAERPVPFGLAFDLGQSML